MTRIRTLAVAGALAALTAITGCAQQPAGGVDAGAGVPAAVPAQPGADVLDGILARLHGTADQREAGQQRQFYAWQAAIGACMVGKGVDFDLPAYVPSGIADTKASPGGLLAFSPRRDDFAIATRATRAAGVDQGNPALAKLTGPAAEAWLKAQQDCEPATKPTEDLGVPAGLSALSNKLIDQLLALQDQHAPGLTQAWRSCMATAAGEPVDDLAAAYAVTARRFPQLPEQAADPAKVPGWAAAVAYEKRIAAADWQCRGNDATRVVAASEPQLTAWAEKHRAELDAVAAQWARMPAERDAAKAAAERAAAG